MYASKIVHVIRIKKLVTLKAFHFPLCPHFIAKIVLPINLWDLHLQVLQAPAVWRFAWWGFLEDLQDWTVDGNHLIGNDTKWSKWFYEQFFMQEQGWSTIGTRNSLVADSVYVFLTSRWSERSLPDLLIMLASTFLSASLVWRKGHHRADKTTDWENSIQTNRMANH